MTEPLHKTSPPTKLGFRFPAEWAAHEATLLGWPFDDAYWEGHLDTARTDVERLVSTIARFEPVKLAVANEEARADATARFAGQNVELYTLELDDIWFRDIAPLFVKNDAGELVATNWRFNGWGGKYRWQKDNQVPRRLADKLGLEHVQIPIVMEGGALDINAKGECLTTKQCLLNPNRNPELSQADIEEYLQAYLGVTRTIWLNKGLEGDKTDGHIDTITRWVSDRTILTSVCEDADDTNFAPLQENLELLKSLDYEVLELPLPKKRLDLGDERLPLTYANFYIGNGFVVVPTYDDVNDERALEILQRCFPKREVIGLPSGGLITGGGSFHCVTQQLPQGSNSQRTTRGHMKLLLLYGPPAAGKLTIAKHIVARSDYKLFDNHASIDLANRIFNRDEAAFGAVVKGVRKLIFEEAARADKNLIFTYVYAHPNDEPEMAWMLAAIEDNGGSVQLVHLTCSAEALKTRVENESRKAFAKINSTEVLEDILERYDVFTPYPERDTLTFDTSKESATAIAAKILLELSAS